MKNDDLILVTFVCGLIIGWLIGLVTVMAAVVFI